MATAPDIYVAKESFTTTLDGESISVRAGVTRVRAGHPLLKGKEMFFEPMEVHYDLERATASPGEKRGQPDAPKATASAPTHQTQEETPAAKAPDDEGAASDAPAKADDKKKKE